MIVIYKASKTPPRWYDYIHTFRIRLDPRHQQHGCIYQPTPPLQIFKGDGFFFSARKNLTCKQVRRNLDAFAYSAKLATTEASNPHESVLTPLVVERLQLPWCFVSSPPFGWGLKWWGKMERNSIYTKYGGPKHQLTGRIFCKKSTYRGPTWYPSRGICRSTCYPL